MRALYVRDFYYSLNEDFKSQRSKFISQGYDEKIVDDYLIRFREIKDKNYKQLYDDLEGVSVNGNDRKDIDKYRKFHDLEVVVDYVSGQKEVKPIRIEKDEDSKIDPIYEDNALMIFRASNAQDCIEIKGNGPYIWCVAQKKNNMYYTYRMRAQKPTFYFIKIKDRTKKELSSWGSIKAGFTGKFNDKWHYFVIQVFKNADLESLDKFQYYVTSANNDGDKNVSWNEIVEIEPRLKNLQYIFSPTTLTKEEKKYYKIFKKGISDAAFCKLSYVEKKWYLDINTVSGELDSKFSANKFNCLPYELKNTYIGFGLDVEDEVYDLIESDKKLFDRYQDVTNRYFDEFFKQKSNVHSLNSSLGFFKSLNRKNKERYAEIALNYLLSDSLKEEIKKDKKLLNKSIEVALSNINSYVLDDLYDELSINQKKRFFSGGVHRRQGYTSHQVEDLKTNQDLKNELTLIRSQISDKKIKYDRGHNDRWQSQLLDNEEIIQELLPLEFHELHWKLLTYESDNIVDPINILKELRKINPKPDYTCMLLELAENKMEMAKFLGKAEITKLNKKHMVSLCTSRKDKKEFIKILYPQVLEVANEIIRACYHVNVKGKEYEYYFNHTYQLNTIDMLNDLGRNMINALDESSILLIIKRQTKQTIDEVLKLLGRNNVAKIDKQTLNLVLSSLKN